jgi:hypothetical protein
MSGKEKNEEVLSGIAKLAENHRTERCNSEFYARSVVAQWGSCELEDVFTSVDRVSGEYSRASEAERRIYRRE